MTDFRVPDPYAALPDLPALEVTSESFTEGATLSAAQLGGKMGVEGGEDRSPQVSWSAGPEGTRTYVVTVFDPDAPTPSGFWHWCLSNIPADVTSLGTGAAADPPAGAIAHRNDGGTREYLGAAPPAGHGPHRYVVCVTAVDVDRLEVDEDASPAVVNFQLFFHGIGRAFLTGTHEEK